MVLLILIVMLALECWCIFLVGELLESLGLAIWIAVATTFIGTTILARARASLQPEVLGAKLASSAGDPTKAMIAAVGPFVGGTLIVFPGFITDVIGLLVLFPPTRGLLSSVLKKLVLSALKKQLEHRMAGQGFNPEDLKRAFGQAAGAPPSGAPRPGAPRPGATGYGRDQVKDADFEVID